MVLIQVLLCNNISIFLACGREICFFSSFWVYINITGPTDIRSPLAELKIKKLIQSLLESISSEL